MELPNELVEALAAVKSAGVITGAGISVESGIRTYRGEGGLYDDPEEGDRTVEALTGSTLEVDPDRTWQAVVKLARAAQGAQPNAAHDALVRMEQALDRFALLTQNVDGLHDLAGSRNVIYIHGNVFDTRCMACPATGRLEREDLIGLERAPRCSECGGVMRPNAVLFGEMLPQRELDRLRREFYDTVPDVVIAVGTSAMFQYIIEPVLHARRLGRLTIEINPEQGPLSNFVDHYLPGPAGTYLPLIAKTLEASSRG
ncbi:MAG: SIR2 family NAD-dependent protein deacylase [Planctomycetota bacterium]|jgi:NAD-dependent deacetylase